MKTPASCGEQRESEVFGARVSIQEARIAWNCGVIGATNSFCWTAARGCAMCWRVHNRFAFCRRRNEEFMHETLATIQLRDSVVVRMCVRVFFVWILTRMVHTPTTGRQTHTHTCSPPHAWYYLWYYYAIPKLNRLRCFVSEMNMKWHVLYRYPKCSAANWNVHIHIHRISGMSRFRSSAESSALRFPSMNILVCIVKIVPLLYEETFIVYKEFKIGF